MDRLKKLISFWKGKKVLITGHTGFKGAWLSIFLNLLGAKIYGYALKPKPNSLYVKSKINQILKKSVISNIEDFKKLNIFLNKVKPEIVFHLAAQPLVSVSYLNPLQTIKTNIIGTTNLLLSINKSKDIKSIVIITTDKVYKIKNKKIFKEDDELGGIDPYSASKACKEIIVNSFVNSIYSKGYLNKRVSTARSGNVIGGGDYSDNRLVPDIIRNLYYKTPLKIRNLNHVRPWQHVIEPIYGYLILAQKQYDRKLNCSNISWNFGPNNKNFLKVSEVLDLFKKKLKKNIILKKINSSYKETKILKLNSNKSKNKLNWRTKWDVLMALKKTIEVEEAILDKKIIIDVCEKQIIEYLKN